MIKIFIGHFTWLPDNPCVFAWDPAQVGKVTVLKEVDSRGRSREEEYRVGEGSGTPRCWVGLEDGARLRSPDRNWRGCPGIPTRPVREAPAGR